jgi:hypothetical protein
VDAVREEGIGFKCLVYQDLIENRANKSLNGIHSRPDLCAALVRIVVADDVHFPFGELDDAFFSEAPRRLVLLLSIISSQPQ